MQRKFTLKIIFMGSSPSHESLEWKEVRNLLIDTQSKLHRFLF